MRAKGGLEWFPARERATAMGIATTAGFLAVGAMVAPPVIVLVAAHQGWRGAFVVTGLIGAVWIAAWFLLYRPPAQSKLCQRCGAALHSGGSGFGNASGP